MSVLFDAEADALTATLGLGSQSVFTLCGWVKVGVDRNAVSTPFGVDGGSASDSLYFATDSTGTTMRVLVDNTSAGDLGSLTVGSWYFLAAVANGTTLTAYLADDEGAWQSFALTMTAGVTVTTARIGRSFTSGEWLSGSVAAVKVWSAALSAAELTTERFFTAPQRTADLQAAWSLATSSSTADSSGNSRPLSGSGVVTDTDPADLGLGLHVMASSGVDVSSLARGTTSTVATFPAHGVAAGRIAVISASTKPNTATWVAPSGGGTVSGEWAFIGNATGGTGSNAADTGLTRIGQWWRYLDGTESGDVTVPTSGGGATCAVMDIIGSNTPGRVARWVTGAAGGNATHATNPAANTGVPSQAPAAGDLIVGCYSTDTDSTAAASSFVMTQSGTTFGPRSPRSRAGNSSGNDNSVFTWTAAVTSGGTTNVIGLGFTWSATSCGPMSAQIFREIALTSSVADTFDDNSIANPPWSANYGTVSETGGRARVAVATTYAGYQTASSYRFDKAQVEVPLVGALNGGTAAYTAAWVAASEVAAGTDVGVYVDRSNDTIRFMSRTSSADGSATVISYDPVAHRFWRMSKSGANLLWETSPTGVTWTTRRTLTLPTWLSTATTCRLQLEGHRDDGTANYSEFDNLNIAQVAAPITNNADGGSSGTTVTTANSGGASGTAWTSVTIDTDATVAYSSATAMSGTTSYRLATGATAGQAILFWNTTALGSPVRSYGRAYVRLSSTAQSRDLIRWRQTSTQVARVRFAAGAGLELRQGSNSAPTSGGTGAVALAANVWYRIEWDIRTGTVTNTIFLYEGHSTTPLEVISGTGTFASGSPNEVAFGQFGNLSNLADLYFDDLLVNDSGLPGPSGQAQTGAAALSAASGLTSATALLWPAATTLSAATSLTAPVTLVRPGAAPLSAASALSADAIRTTAGVAALSAATTLTAAGASTVAAATALSAASGLLITGAVTRPGTANLSAASELSAAAVRVVPTAAGLSAAGELSAAGAAAAGGAAALSASSALSAAAVRYAFGAAALSGATGLSAAAVLVRTGSTSLSATSALVVGPFGELGAAVLSAGSGLQAAGWRITTGQVVLSAASVVDAQAQLTISLAATLSAVSGLQAMVAVPVHAGAAALLASSSLSAELVSGLSGIAIMRAQTTLLLSARRIAAGQAVLSALGTVAADGRRQLDAEALLVAATAMLAGGSTEPLPAYAAAHAIGVRRPPGAISVRQLSGGITRTDPVFGSVRRST